MGPYPIFFSLDFENGRKKLQEELMNDEENEKEQYDIDDINESEDADEGAQGK